MTPVTLYELSGRIAGLLLGCCGVWTAICYVLFYALHYEPVRDKRVLTLGPTSPRGRLVYAPLAAVFGIAFIVVSMKLPSTSFAPERLGFAGWLSPLLVLGFFVASWRMGIELRQAFGLRRQRREAAESGR